MLFVCIIPMSLLLSTIRFSASERLCVTTVFAFGSISSFRRIHAFFLVVAAVTVVMYSCRFFTTCHRTNCELVEHGKLYKRTTSTRIRHQRKRRRQPQNDKLRRDSIVLSELRLRRTIHSVVCAVSVVVNAISCVTQTKHITHAKGNSHYQNE